MLLKVVPLWASSQLAYFELKYNENSQIANQGLRQPIKVISIIW